MIRVIRRAVADRLSVTGSDTVSSATPLVVTGHRDYALSIRLQVSNQLVVLAPNLTGTRDNSDL